MSKKRVQKQYDSAEKNTLDQLFNASATEELWDKLDEYQRLYASEVDKRNVVFVDAAAGTGKTTVAVMKALDMLRKGKISSIVYARLPDKRSGKLGFLPGELADKTAGFMAPFYDALSECGIQPEAERMLKEKGFIETTTDVFMRGRNLKGVFLIIDEAQNAADITDLQLLLTRPDDNTKICVIGHSEQIDGNVKLYGKDKLNAFQVYAYHMTKKSWATSVKLVTNYRGKVSQWADKVWESVKELE